MGSERFGIPSSSFLQTKPHMFSTELTRRPRTKPLSQSCEDILKSTNWTHPLVQCSLIQCSAPLVQCQACRAHLVPPIIA